MAGTLNKFSKRDFLKSYRSCSKTIWDNIFRTPTSLLFISWYAGWTGIRVIRKTYWVACDSWREVFWIRRLLDMLFKGIFILLLIFLLVTIKYRKNIGTRTICKLKIPRRTCFILFLFNYYLLIKSFIFLLNKDSIKIAFVHSHSDTSWLPLLLLRNVQDCETCVYTRFQPPELVS